MLILKQIKLFFGVGNIVNSGTRDSVYYSVNSIQDIINVIIPHFLKYPLITQKRADFLLFKEIVELIAKKKHLTLEGLRQILAIRASINIGFSFSLNESFPNIIPVPRPVIKDQEIIDPYWFAGFTEGEGCFFCGYF